MQTSKSVLSQELSSRKREFSVYTQGFQGNLIRVGISTSTPTVGDAIEVALQ